jgi:hypothetical protein
MRHKQFIKPLHCVHCIVRATQLIQETVYKWRAMSRFLNTVLKSTDVFTANRKMDGSMLYATSLYSPEEFNELKAADLYETLKLLYKFAWRCNSEANNFSVKVRFIFSDFTSDLLYIFLHNLFNDIR